LFLQLKRKAKNNILIKVNGMEMVQIEQQVGFHLL
jgi:hypothetical protein